jgi:hypothetical protein
MLNPIETIQRSIDDLFQRENANQPFSTIKTYTEPSGSSSDVWSVPPHYAMQGFSEMQDRKSPYLTLRQVKDRQKHIGRRAIELHLWHNDSANTLLTPALFDELYVIDDTGLYSTSSPASWLMKVNLFHVLGGLDDITRPIDVHPKMRLRSEKFTSVIARKIADVAAAQQPVTKL